MNIEEANRRLFQAAKAGSVTEAQAALDAGADVHVMSKWEHTPLHVAAECGQIDIIRLLVERGADVNARDPGGDTPLHCAALRSRVYVIQELLQSGADRTIKAANGMTAEEVMLGGTKNLFLTARRREGHASRVTEERKDKGPPQVGG